MKFLRLLFWPIAAFSIASLVVLAAEDPDPREIEIAVGRLLEQGHYSRKKLDDTVSRQLLKNYLEVLDYNHLFFTQKDVDGFNAKYATTLDEAISQGFPEPAFAIYDAYKKRVEDRITKVKELLGKQYDFKSDRAIEVNRQKAPWPKDDADADRIWRDRVEGEFLQETLNKHKIDPPTKVLTRRYDQVLRNLHEQNREDVMKTFLSVLAQTYDPHSEYLSRSELENFSINMRLSLVGIGAVLQADEGYAKINELVAGGPASKSELKVGDRVTAVAQGEKEFVDTVDMKLDKVVEMIRGKKDTVVRLQVIPVNATDPSTRKIIAITRDEIKLKEQEAKAEIIDRTLPGGAVQRIGWITLPSFYADMEHSGAANAKSTTRDVLALLTRLKQEGISGLVMDLRRNGGGSLEEAVNLTGLFIKKGPVVQSKESNGTEHISRDRDTGIAYDGPLVVLTNRLSASASEIFAAALQDYNRAVIVGDSSTFGKGTVQTMLEIGRIMPFLGGGNNQAGALKLTIQKFYRVAGGSTQLRGVEPDVRIPSPFDHPEIGESAMKNPLPYDTVKPVRFDKLEGSLFKTELRERSAARIAVDPEFGYIMEDLAQVKKRLAENVLSLNIDKRRAEIDDEKARKDKRTAERKARHLPEEKHFALTLDSVNKPELQLVTNEKKKQDAASATTETDGDEDDPSTEEDESAGGKRVDAVGAEAINIVADLASLIRGVKAPATASTQIGK
jgi:carboxyl-terminal processing protease